MVYSLKCLSKDKLITFFKIQARIRLIELYLAKKYPEQQMKCPMHLCLGQESVAAACGVISDRQDIFMGNYRSHGHYLAKGGNLFRLFAELLGRQEGCSGGMGGSMHLIDLECMFYGTSAIVGATIPISTGIALGAAYNQRKQVVFVFFGDGAMEEGVIYESILFAKLHRLSIIFVCENNQLAIDTPLSLRTPSSVLHNRFRSLNIHSHYIDTLKIKNITYLLKKTLEAYHFVKRTSQPCLLEFKVSRWASHVGPQFEGPVHAWWQNPWSKEATNCTLVKTVRYLLHKNILTLPDIKMFYADEQKKIETTFKQALKNTTPPAFKQIKHLVYASGLESALPFKKNILHHIPNQKTNDSYSTNPF